MSRESTFGKLIMQRHGARKDLRLFRNTVGEFWAGEFAGRTPAGIVMLRHGTKVHGGLPDGSADYIGIRQGGQLLSLEIKKETGGRTSKEQLAWRDMILGLGGEARVCSTMQCVDEMLGEP